MPGLHHELCSNRAEDIARMQTILEKWRGLNEPETALNPALVHAVEKGHDMCVNFLYSCGASGNVRDLLQSATEQSRPAVFKILLKNGCTQAEINSILKYIEFVINREHDAEVDIIKLIIENNFSFENFDYYLFGPRINDFHYRTVNNYVPLSKAYVCFSSVLKFLLLSGGVVDYLQLPYENLTQHLKDKVSLIQHFIKVSASPSEEYNDSSNFVAEDYFEALYILRQCGTNFAEINAEGKSLLDLIEDNREEAAEEPEEHIVEYCDQLTSKIQEYQSEPLSLKSLSRLKLIRHLKVCYLKNVNNLTPSHCPQDVINFLKGDDMKVSDLYTVSGKECMSAGNRIYEYKPLVDKYLTSNVMPLKMRNKLRSIYVSDRFYSADVNVLNEELKKLQTCGQIIMKFIYNI